MHPRTIKLAADGALELIIYGDIGLDFFGDGVSAVDVVRFLSAHADAPSITVRLNSPGGSAFDGIAIYNALKSHAAEITVRVDGSAASAASIIAMAGDRIEMATGAMMMIHNAGTVTRGNSEAMRKTADMMDKLNAQMATIYAERGTETAERYAEMMNAETWFTGPEAIAVGLADEEVTAPAMAAHFDPSAYDYRNAPPHFFASAPPSQPPARAAAAPEPRAPRAQGARMHKILAKALGLDPETATEAEIVAAASAAVATAKASAAVTAKAGEDRTILAAIERHTGKAGEEAVAMIVAWKGSEQRAADAEAKLAEQVKAAADEHAEQAITSLAPSVRDAAREMYADFGEKGLAAFVKSLPEAMKAKGDSADPTPADPGAEEGALTAEERQVAKALGHTDDEIRALRPLAKSAFAGGAEVVIRRTQKEG